MATGKHSDLSIFNEEYYGGQVEVTAQNINGFNAGSNGAITLRSELLEGWYEKTNFFPLINGLTGRRDLTSVSAAAGTALTMTEIVSVKQFRKIGPLENTLSQWYTLGRDPSTFSFALGQMIGQQKIADHLNLALGCLENAIEAVGTDAYYDATGQTTKTMTPAHMIEGMKKFGDQAGRIALWVMHSKVYFDLMKQHYTDKIFGVADVTLREGSAATLGRPVLVTDSSYLTDANGSLTDTYNTLGLVAGACEVVESEPEELVLDKITGYQNLIYRLQGEYALSFGLKGFTWDTSNGGANPTDATLVTGTNWDKVATSVKDTAGIRIVTQ